MILYWLCFIQFLSILIFNKLLKLNLNLSSRGLAIFASKNKKKSNLNMILMIKIRYEVEEAKQKIIWAIGHTWIVCNSRCDMELYSWYN